MSNNTVIITTIATSVSPSRIFLEFGGHRNVYYFLEMSDYRNNTGELISINKMIVINPYVLGIKVL